MTVTDAPEQAGPAGQGPDVDGRPTRQSLGTGAARNLTTTTKSAPQMRAISPRWLLRMLPWVDVPSGTYRVNRRLTYPVGDGRLTCTNIGAEVRVAPEALADLPMLRGFDEPAILTRLAERFEQREFRAGEVLVEAGRPADQMIVIAHGKARKLRAGKYGAPSVLATLGDGDHVGNHALLEPASDWGFTLRAVTACTVLALSRRALDEAVGRSEALRAHVQRLRAYAQRPRNKHGEAAIDMASGHQGEPQLPATFVDYETSPREYELSVAQTVLRVHSRVADLFNHPMSQTRQQLRLTIEALRERQEHEMINNYDFGLLHNAALNQRIHTRHGPPTPDDLDELLSRRRKSRFFLAHPRTIAAFGRECNHRGIYPATTRIDGTAVIAWRGVPLLPCNKIPITDAQTSSILVLRTGADSEGVVGLHQTGLPDEYEPGLSVRFIDINDKAIISYLVSAYFSAAPLVPDALGVLEDVEIGVGQ